MPSQKSENKHKADPQTYEFEAIGTHWTIELFDVASTRANKTFENITHRIEQFDKTYSRFRADSLITQMSQKPGDYTLPDDAKPMLDLYQKLYRLSAGNVTPLVGQLLADAGYDADYSLKPKTLRTVPSWDDCLDYNFPNLTIKQPVLFDFGALGKGYLVDIVGEIIRGCGCDTFIINAGGDILHHGPQPIEVALENPTNIDEAIGIASLHNRALCGSAGSRRTWSNFTHIFNPRTRQSVTHISAIWATAQTTMLADAMTTALYFVGPKRLQQDYTFTYAIIHDDRSLAFSNDFPAKFFDNETEN